MALVPQVNARSELFSYQLKPSAFKLAELPTYLAAHCLERYLQPFATRLWREEKEYCGNFFAKRALAFLSVTVGYVGGMIALPITVACTPVTIVADIVIGIAECSFCCYRGLPTNDIKTIAYRKCLISPLHQIIFCISTVALGILMPICMFLNEPYRFYRDWKQSSYSNSGYAARLIVGISVMLWPLGYVAGQIAKKILLPPELNPQEFNIFISKSRETVMGHPGVGIALFFAQTWVKGLGDVTQIYREVAADYSNGLEYTEEPTFGRSSNNSPWNNVIGAELSKIKRLDSDDVDSEYLAFKRGVLAYNTPQKLLGLPDGFSQVAIGQRFRRFSMLFHPDKNSSIEAGSLHTILIAARDRLVEEARQAGR